MEVNKDVERLIKNYGPDDSMDIAKILKTRSRDPVVKLSLSMFRESVVFRDMTHSFIFDLKCKVRDLNDEIIDLRSRIEELEAEE